jgi:DNA repair exonuclease SbcCD ATPase subunit
MQLHDRLGWHFAKEQAGGYLESAAEKLPELKAKVASLLEQHQQFRRLLDELSAKLASGQVAYANWDDPHHELEEILAKLQDHEAAENAILRAAFGQDYGDVRT